RDLELIEAVEMQAVGGQRDGAEPEILDRGVDAADRAAQRALAAVVDRARDLEVDDPGLVLAAEQDHPAADLEVMWREQRQRDVDAVECERLEDLALL